IRITQNYDEYNQFYFIFNDFSLLREGWDIEISPTTRLNEYIKNYIESDEEKDFILENIEKEKLGKITLDELIEKLTPGGFLYDVTGTNTKRILKLINDFLNTNIEYKENLNYQII